LEEIIEEFEEIIGLDKLWIIHVNDSIFDLGQKKDRHENIGFGKIGFDALKRIVWHPKFNKVVKILETPTKRDIYKQEIIMLKQI
jgi:deoxyribonuclease-4